MSIYVLVHGGYSVGQDYRDVAIPLREAGHEVFTPTLTGLGERAHLVSREIGLDTHIQDIVGIIECEDQDVILAGHSSGSMAVTGVVERIPERMKCLVYIDTVVPKDGQSWFDLLGPEVAKVLLDLANNRGDGWLLPLEGTPDPPRHYPYPLKALTDHIEVKNPAAVNVPHAFIHCTVRPEEGLLVPFFHLIDKQAEEEKELNWWYRSLPTVHACHRTMPKELAELLLEQA